jgi:integrase
VALTDVACRKAKAAEKDYKLADSGGLYLFVTKTGARSWRMKYRFAGKERRLTFGLYPEVGLAEARDRRDEARKLLRANIDPAVDQKKRRFSAEASAAHTFEKVARGWLETQAARWSPIHRKKSARAFERDVFPDLGGLPIAEVDGPMILTMLRKIEKRGAIDTAKRIRQHVSGIFAAAISENLVATDPSASLGKALKPLPKKGKQPARTDLPRARQVLIDVEGSTAQPLTKLASRLLAITAVRPGIVRAAVWSEFEGIDWDKPDEAAAAALWRIPADRMKLDLEQKDEEAFDHLVPLPAQAVAVVHAVRRLSGRIPFLFPNGHSTARPMSENALSYAYNRAGHYGRHVPHGWRASFSTIMNEWIANHGRDTDRAVIDGMLAHKPKGVSGSEMAYNRALHMTRRRELATIWADMLCEGLVPADALLVAHD